MKKLMFLVAAASLCATTMAGCGDDSSSKTKLGDPCKADKECASSFCDLSTVDNDGNGVCAKKVDLLDNGKDCTEDSQCQSGWCKADADDPNKKVCTAKLGENEDCAGFENYCAENLTCKVSGESKACGKSAQKAQIGEECKINAGCDNSFCKKEGDAETGICTAFLADGEDCAEAAQCQNGYCNKANESDATGKCAAGEPKLPFGSPCTEDSECDSNNCTGQEGSKTCDKMDPCKNFAPHCDHSGASPVAFLRCSPDPQNEEEAVYATDQCDGATPLCVEDAEAGTASCTADSEVGSCFYDSDCTDVLAAKCGDDDHPYQCVVPTESDPCVQSDGTTPLCDDNLGQICEKGACVTDSMKAMAGNAGTAQSCNSENFPNQFCYEDKPAKCVDGVVVVAESSCADLGAGSCTIAEIDGSDTAVCSGSPESIQNCRDFKQAEMNMCAIDKNNDNFVVHSTCVYDKSWKLIAAPVDAFIKCQAATPYCNIQDGSGATCGTEQL